MSREMDLSVIYDYSYNVNSAQNFRQPNDYPPSYEEATSINPNNINNMGANEPVSVNIDIAPVTHDPTHMLTNVIYQNIAHFDPLSNTQSQNTTNYASNLLYSDFIDTINPIRHLEPTTWSVPCLSHKSVRIIISCILLGFQLVLSLWFCSFRVLGIITFISGMLMVIMPILTLCIILHQAYKKEKLKLLRSFILNIVFCFLFVVIIELVNLTKKYN